MGKYILCFAAAVMMTMIVAFPGAAQRAAVEQPRNSSGFLKVGKEYQFRDIRGVRQTVIITGHAGENWVKVKFNGDSGWFNLDTVSTITEK